MEVLFEATYTPSFKKRFWHAAIEDHHLIIIPFFIFIGSVFMPSSFAGGFLATGVIVLASHIFSSFRKAEFYITKVIFEGDYILISYLNKKDVFSVKTHIQNIPFYGKNGDSVVFNLNHDMQLKQYSLLEWKEANMHSFLDSLDSARKSTNTNIQAL